MSKKTESIRNEKATQSKQMKKMGLIGILCLIVIAVSYVVITKPKVEKQESTAPSFVQTTTVENAETNAPSDVESQGTDLVKVTKLSDGILYSLKEDNKRAEIVVGDNYYDTLLSDIYTNYEKYAGKTIEIEGFYLENTPYTFVGRYSESNLCSYCPPGFSYFEYEWHGDNQFQFTNEKEWLKIKGTISKNFDEKDGVDYYFIDASSIEVMNEPGQTTVKN